MASDKRKMNPQFEQDDDFFQIKKKSSYISLDTNDSAPKEDTNLSPIVLKPYNGEPAVPTDSQTSVIKDKPLVTKALSHKKKENSAQSVSFDEGVKYYMSDPSRYIDTFKAVKYKNIKYNLGDNMQIKNEGDSYNDFVCKLVRVIKPAKRDNRGILAFLEIQWYYKRDELPKKYAASQPHFSIYEVFLSTHKDFVMVECINGPCKVLRQQEFDKLGTILPGTYFTRATYDAGRKRLDPPIESWEKVCVCKTPLNPDRNYIQCDKCESWYHQDCVGLSKEETHAIEQYFCSSCKEKKETGDIGFNFDKQQELLFDENMFAMTTNSSDKPKDGFNDAFLNAGQNTGKTEGAVPQTTDDSKMFDFMTSPQGDLTDIFFESFDQSDVKIDFDQGFN